MGDLVPYAGTGTALALANQKDPEVAKAEQEKRIKEAEVLEAKLKIINETIPTRIYNTMSSTAGAGSGDFHYYRQIKKAETQRLQRIEQEFEKKKEQEEWEARQQERQKEADERTAKRRAKRQKKKAKGKKPKADGSANQAAGEVDGAVASGSEASEDEAPEQAALD